MAKTDKNKNERDPATSLGDLRKGGKTESPHNYIDPILEASHRVWHVRDTDQNGSGPYKGKELRQRIENELLPGHFEVCREDWEDWRLASDVFPELGASRSKIPLASDSVFTDRNYQIERPPTAKNQRKSKKKRDLIFGAIALAVALLLTLGLCYLLASLV